MATKGAYKRLTKEYIAIQKNPPPFITAKPLESNILEWHYVIRGPPDTPYEGGEYYGRITFPSEYPFKPPAIRMTTPSGRFQPDTRLCLSMSDFHPSTWNPSWSIATILNGLLSFMVGDEATTGSIKTSNNEKKLYAARSHLWNIRHSKFREVFPELCTVNMNDLQNLDQHGLTKRNVNKSSSTNTNTNIKQGNSNNVGSRQTSSLVHQQQIQQTAAVDAGTAQQQQQGQQQSQLISKGKRWIFVFVVFMYLILSKLIARSTSTA